MNGLETFDNESGIVDMANLLLIDTDILIDAGRKIKKAVTYLNNEEQNTILGINRSVTIS